MGIWNTFGPVWLIDDTVTKIRWWTFGLIDVDMFLPLYISHFCLPSASTRVFPLNDKREKKQTPRTTNTTTTIIRVGSPPGYIGTTHNAETTRKWTFYLTNRHILIPRYINKVTEPPGVYRPLTPYRFSEEIDLDEKNSRFCKPC